MRVLCLAARVVFSRYRYVVIAVGAWFTIYGIIVWLLIFPTLIYVLGLPTLPISDKISFFLRPYQDSFIYFFSDPVVAGRLIFSLLAAIVVTFYTYIRDSGGGGHGKKKIAGGVAVALTGSGCITCGTSLLFPFLAGVGGGTSYYIGTTSKAYLIGIATGTLIYLLSIILILVALYGLSKRVLYNTRSQK